MGKYLRIVATATNAGGSRAATSDIIGPVRLASEAQALTSFAPSVISGPAIVGQVLEASEGVWLGPPDTAFRYQWRRCFAIQCEDISGAVTPYYSPTSADTYAKLTVSVTATSLLATAASMTSVPSSPTDPDPNTFILNTPSRITPTGAQLSWSSFTGSGFIRYEVHRSLTPNFTPDATTFVAAISVPTQTTYTDTTGYAEEVYYYKIVARASTSATSNEQQATLPPPGMLTDVVQITPTSGQATFIYKNSGDPSATCRNNGADPNMLVGVSDPYTAHALLKFALPGIPLGSVDHASLLVQEVAPPNKQMSVRVHEATTDWTEGSGLNTCTGDGASWANARAGTNWTSPGGDIHRAHRSLQGARQPSVGELRRRETLREQQLASQSLAADVAPFLQRPM